MIKVDKFIRSLSLVYARESGTWYRDDLCRECGSQDPYCPACGRMGATPRKGGCLGLQQNFTGDMACPYCSEECSSLAK
mgnify:FL=1